VWAFLNLRTAAATGQRDYISNMVQQDQFLNVVDRDEAERRFRAALDLRPLPAETVPLGQALGRVLAADVAAPVDVPGFDRANVDGFAVRAEDTFGATEHQPCVLQLTGEVLTPGVVWTRALRPGVAAAIATGGLLPRGADAVVMVEHTDIAADAVEVRRPVTPGGNVTCAGTDIGRGETVLRQGDVLTSRETGVLAALGVAAVAVVRRPRVAVLSTGNELIEPGTPPRPGLVYDSNATTLADAVRELGGEPVPLGIVPDDRAALRQRLQAALACDVVLLSGGTSKGEGDLCYRVVAELGPPGIVAHGVALKPGKPLCLAATRTPDGRTVPVVILPGFPTSALFTFHEFVAPVLRLLGGRGVDGAEVVQARLPVRVNSERGRTEYLLVALVASAEDGGSRMEDRGSRKTEPLPSILDPPSSILVAYPLGKGSGSVTAFSRADGFVTIPRQQEYVEAGTTVDVRLLARGLKPADLVVIGSHCVGLDHLLGHLQAAGWRTKLLAVGSTAGLDAARRAECDLAGIHLLDPRTGVYNRPFVGAELQLEPGYQRLQGLVFRADDGRFAGRPVAEAVAAALADPECVLVNRNRGSGTRVLIDQLLGAARPAGHGTEARSHNAVAAAVQQGRADWGVAIQTVAAAYGLGFLPLRAEQYDFVLPRSRLDRPAVRAFRELLRREPVRAELRELGFHPS
jgi:putative molybdopterin biosynthesis protein